ncbi:MAG TPA: serine/threonine-protein kinase, partial [Kofleriaceae bacterium]
MAEPPDRTATLVRPTSSGDAGEREDRRGLHAGALLSKYTLERVLGEGGMGIVWSARDPDLQRAVAIKLLQCDDASPDARQRLLREARAMARLKHPNVITVYEVDSDGDRDFISMELVEGANLNAWLCAEPPSDEVWRAVIAAGRGLAAAHAAGLVHRDFKPHNVLRSRDGRVLVTDFGLARGTGERAPAAATTLPAEPVALAQTLPAP